MFFLCYGFKYALCVYCCHYKSPAHTLQQCIFRFSLSVFNFSLMPVYHRICLCDTVLGMMHDFSWTTNAFSRAVTHRFLMISLHRSYSKPDSEWVFHFIVLFVHEWPIHLLQWCHCDISLCVPLKDFLIQKTNFKKHF